MAKYMKVNGSELLALSDVRRVCPITDKERTSLSQLGSRVDANRFNSRIDYKNGGKSYAPETIRDLVEQGVNFVKASSEAFVPRQNIRTVRNLTANDRSTFEKGTGRTMGDHFQSQIQTTAGPVWSTADALTVQERMRRPYNPDISEPEVLRSDNGVRTPEKDEPARANGKDAPESEGNDGREPDEGAPAPEQDQSMSVRRDEVMSQVSTPKKEASTPSRSPEQ